MNAAHLHLVLVHVPIVAIPAATIILIFGMLRKNGELSSAALVLFCLIALVTIPAYLAGEGAEELIEHLPGIIEDNIEKHEDAALVAFILVLCNGTLSLATLIVNRLRAASPPFLLMIVLFFALFTSAALIWAGNLGGLIRHPEIIAATDNR